MINLNIRVPLSVVEEVISYQFYKANKSNEMIFYICKIFGKIGVLEIFCLNFSSRVLFNELSGILKTDKVSIVSGEVICSLPIQNIDVSFYPCKDLDMAKKLLNNRINFESGKGKQINYFSYL